MLDKTSDYIAQARVLLQDTVAPYRYSDVELAYSLAMSLMEAKRLRPDLYLNKTIPTIVGVILGVPTLFDEVIDVDEMYRQAHLYYMVGQMQLRDDEAVQDARAAAFLGMFTNKLLSAQA